MDFEALRHVLPKPHCQWNQEQIYIWLRLISLENLQPYFLGCTGKTLSQHDPSTIVSRLKIPSKIQSCKILQWLTWLPLFDQALHQNQKQFPPSLKKAMSTQQNGIDMEESATDVQMTMSRATHLSQRNLIIEERNTKSLACFRFTQEDALLGKHRDCDVLALEPTVAARHCAIIYNKPHYYLKPLPTQDCRNRGYEQTWVKVDDRVLLKEEVTLEMGTNCFLVTPGTTLTLTIIKGNNSGEVYVSESNRVFVGRRIQCQLCLPLDTTLSALHGKFTKKNQSWFFEDMKTTNGSWVLVVGRQRIKHQMTFKLGGAFINYYCRLQDKKDIVKKPKCPGCKSSAQDSFFEPCFHCTHCYPCAEAVKVCPVCKQAVSKVFKIYSG